MKRILTVIAALLLTGICQAQSTLPQLLQQVSDGGAWTESQAHEFLALIMGDSHMQPEEEAWIAQLATATTDPVDLEVDGHVYHLAAPQGRAHDLIELLHARPNLHKLWDGTPEQFGQLIDIACICDPLYLRVGSFAMSRLKPVLDQSGDRNQWLPIMIVVDRCAKKCDKLDPERRKAGRLLLWRCLHQYEIDNKFNLPNAVINWLPVQDERPNPTPDPSSTPAPGPR